MVMVIDGTNGITFPDTSRQYNSYYNFKNRIINGAMVIDQRNAGASVAITTSDNYTLDRWQGTASANSRYTIQQNAASVTPPAGFINYLGATSVSSGAPGSTDTYLISQFIEGLNVADLGWGTANAQTVTLSFWVRSSLTGAFGGTVTNSASNRSYPFSYTISAANTWEQKSITIPGDTSGTWLTTNGIGLRLRFSMGMGSSFLGTAGAWAGSFVGAPTGSTNVIATNGATWYVTGVQLEEGIVSTPFDFRPYTTELQLCQRYLPAFNSSGTLSAIGAGQALSTTSALILCVFPVQTRVAPSGISVSSVAHISTRQPSGGAVTYSTSATLGNSSTTSGEVVLSGGSGGTAAGGSSTGYFNSASGQILFNGCEL
jgi:hypothetical protein